MKQLFIMLLLVLTSCVQSNKVSDEGSRKIVETFFVTYESAGAEKALNEIFATNINFLKLPTHSIDELREKLKSCENTMGKYFGYEIIAKRVIGKTIVHYSCIVNYELQPLRYSFTLYKPKDRWMLYNFKFDSELTNELDESAKIYYIE